MLSFHNDKKVKDKFIARMQEHAKADEIIQGTGWDKGKGCFVGCTLHEYNHAKFESIDGPGLPEWLAMLADKLFEGLTNADAKQFAANFYDDIPVGVDLESVKWKFCAFILRENIDRVLGLPINKDLKKQVISAIKRCLKVFEDAIATSRVDKKAAELAAWSAVMSAWVAEESAALSARAAQSVAWSAARSTLLSAWLAALSAALSVTESVGSAARSAVYKRYADELMRLLREAK